MVASALGHSHNARVVNIPLKEEIESAYAIYDEDQLSKLAIVNMQAFNQTATGTRPSKEYTFEVGHHRHAKIETLIAPGSDATTDVTFAGISYDHNLAMGKPVVLGPNKFVTIENGVLRVDVSDSSAVVVTLY